MGTDNINKRRSIERKQRISKELQTRAETWLIVCEGTKTEPNYFNALFDYINSKYGKKINCVVKGTGKNTKGVVKSVDEFFRFSDDLVSSTDIPYGKVFTVFDKDDFSDSDFNSAIKMSEQKGYITLWSNQCIELCFILHFEYFHSNCSRKDYIKKLNKILSEKYEKNGRIFDLLGQLTNVQTALKNSKKLFDSYKKEQTPSKKAPCTTIFRLFDEIEEYLGFKLK